MTLKSRVYPDEAAPTLCRAVRRANQPRVVGVLLRALVTPNNASCLWRTCTAKSSSVLTPSGASRHNNRRSQAEDVAGEHARLEIGFGAEAASCCRESTIGTASPPLAAPMPSLLRRHSHRDEAA